jgi:kinesin family protein 6/9
VEQIPQSASAAAAQATQKLEAAVAANGAAGTSEAHLLLARNGAFEQFRRSYRRNAAIEENKVQLRTKYDEAKALGETVNSARTAINALKGRIEAVRRDAALSTLADLGSSEQAEAAAGADAAEQGLRAELEGAKRRYKADFAALKTLKGEIEHLQLMLEQSRRRLQVDFEAWWSAGGAKEGGAPTSAPRTAGVPPATGNAEVDAEIAQFWAARDQLVARKLS